MESLALLLHPEPTEDVYPICLNVLQFVVHAMGAHPSDAHIQECGCEILALIASVEQLQEAFVASGAIKALTTAMRNFEGNTGIQRRGCRAFANLADYHQSP